MRVPTILPAAAALVASACAHGPRLEPGATAPAFELMGSDGQTHSLASHLGKEVVVLAWFPKAFTGG